MTKDELISQSADLAETMREIKEMFDSRAWQRYSGLVDAQIKGRIDTLVLTPLPSMDAVLGAEYAKGEIAGLKLSQSLPATIIEDLETERQALERSLGAEDE